MNNKKSIIKDVKSPTITAKNLFFNLGVSIDYDVPTAIFLTHLSFWTEKNLANGRHLYDGYVWSHDTLKALQTLIPCYSKKQIEKMINNCESNGLVIKGNYNKTRYDRTCWYALTPKAFVYFTDLNTNENINLLKESEAQKGEIDFSIWGNEDLHLEKPIPDADHRYKTDDKKNNIKKISSDSEKSNFEQTPKSCNCEKSEPQPNTSPPSPPKKSKAKNKATEKINSDTISKGIKKNRKANSELENGQESYKNEAEEVFNIFYSIYPMKKNKKGALRVWMKNKLYNEAHAIIEKLELQIQKDEHFAQNFIPNPANYLRDRRFEDEIKEKKINQQTGFTNSRYSSRNESYIHTKNPENTTVHAEKDVTKIYDVDENGEVIHKQELAVSEPVNKNVSQMSEEEMRNDPRYSWAFHRDVFDDPNGIKFI